MEVAFDAVLGVHFGYAPRDYKGCSKASEAPRARRGLGAESKYIGPSPSEGRDRDCWAWVLFDVEKEVEATNKE